MRHLFLVTSIAAAVTIATLPRSTGATERPFDTRSPAGNDHANGPKPKSAPHSVPEFDPATAGAIAAVLAGGGVLIARRRRR